MRKILLNHTHWVTSVWGEVLMPFGREFCAILNSGEISIGNEADKWKSVILKSGFIGLVNKFLKYSWANWCNLKNEIERLLVGSVEIELPEYADSIV